MPYLRLSLPTTALVVMSVLCCAVLADFPANAADPAPAATSGKTPTSAKKTTASAAAENFFVAGLKPSRRPAGAPTITTVSRNDDWRVRALKGVTQPVPASLGFLSSQGNWYTPFDRAGMTGPYDMRGWHG